MRFLPGAAGVLTLAAGAGWLLWLSFETGGYVPFVFTAGGTMLVGATGLLAVRLGHCRSVAASLALGLLAGALVHPGPHLFAYLRDPARGPLSARGFVAHLDARFASRDVKWGLHPEVLPIDDPQAQPTPADRLSLWGSAAIELLFLLFAGVLPLVLRVRRTPYCEVSRGWTERRRLGFEPAAEPLLRRALDEGKGNLVAAAAETVVPLHPNQPALVGLLHTCPDPLCSGPAGYLSLRQSAGEAVASFAMEELFPVHPLRPRCAVLTAAEVRGLVALLPASGGPGTELALPPWVAEVAAETTRGGAVTADLEPVQQGHPEPAVTAATRARAPWLDLLPLLLGVGLTAALIGLLAAFDLESDLTAVLVLLAPCLVALLFVLRDPNRMSNHLLLRRLDRRIAARPQPLVSPRDEDALPVALVPRGVWTQDKGSEQIDHGYLAVRGSALLYEGDRWRLRAPAAAVLGLAVERLVVDRYQRWHFAVVSVRGARSLHELPFVRIAPPLGELLLRSERRRSAVLLARVAELPAAAATGAAQRGAGD
jgi:hypothetical protein